MADVTVPSSIPLMRDIQRAIAEAHHAVHCVLSALVTSSDEGTCNFCLSARPTTQLFNIDPLTLVSLERNHLVSPSNSLLSATSLRVPIFCRLITAFSLIDVFSQYP